MSHGAAQSSTPRWDTRQRRMASYVSRGSSPVGHDISCHQRCLSSPPLSSTARERLRRRDTVECPAGGLLGSGRQHSVPSLSYPGILRSIIMLICILIGTPIEADSGKSPVHHRRQQPDIAEHVLLRCSTGILLRNPASRSCVGCDHRP